MNNNLNLLLNKNNGYIKMSDFICTGINKHEVKKLLENNTIKKVSHGLYLDYRLNVDQFF